MKISDAIAVKDQETGTIIQYSDALRKFVKEFTKSMSPHFSKARLVYQEKQCFYTDGHTTFYLCVDEYCNGEWGIMCKSAESTDGTLIENVSQILLCAAVLRIPELMANYKKLHDKRTKDWIHESEAISAINDPLQDWYKALIKNKSLSLEATNKYLKF